MRQQPQECNVLGRPEDGDDDWSGAGSLCCQVCGVAFYSLSVCGARVGDCVEFVRRPDNPYDSNCVDVRIVRRGRSLLLGHLAADVAEQLSPLLLGTFQVSG